MFIDEEIVYTGSLNVLSHIGTTEFMQRAKSPKFAKKLRQFRDLDTLVEAPTKWGPDIQIFFEELPKADCKNCGKSLVLRNGKYGAFYGCIGYPICKYTEDIAESHLSSLQRLTNTSCGGCGGRTSVKTNRKDAWIVCSAPIPCGYGQHISYVKAS